MNDFFEWLHKNSPVIAFGLCLFAFGWYFFPYLHNTGRSNINWTVFKQAFLVSIKGWWFIAASGLLIVVIIARTLLSWILSDRN